MHKPITVIFYYQEFVIYIIICAMILYDWQCRKFVYINITSNMSNAMCYDVVMATT